MKKREERHSCAGVAGVAVVAGVRVIVAVIVVVVVVVVVAAAAAALGEVRGSKNAQQENKRTSTSQDQKQEQHIPIRHAGRPADSSDMLRSSLHMVTPYYASVVLLQPRVMRVLWPWRSSRTPLTGLLEWPRRSLKLWRSEPVTCCRFRSSVPDWKKWRTSEETTLLMLLYQLVACSMSQFFKVTCGRCLSLWHEQIQCIALEAMSTMSIRASQSMSGDILTKPQRDVWRFDTATDLPQGWPAAHCHAAAVSRGEILKGHHTAGCHAGQMWTTQTLQRRILRFKEASSQPTNGYTHRALVFFPIDVAQAIFQ